MATIVSGFLVPHAPLMCAIPQAPSAAQKDACWAGFQTVIDRLKQDRIDTVIIIGDDHYTLFGPQCIPSVLIGIGDVRGPVEPWLNVPRVRIENNEPLAQHIMRHGHRNGVDWAVSKFLTVDHSVYVPYHYGVKPVEGVRTIPVYLSSGVDPLIDSRRAYHVGQSIADAVATWQGNERVAVFGTGGMAHWPGEARMADLDPVWDAKLLDMFVAGDVEGMIAMSDEEVCRDAGSGALELKNYLCMLGAVGPGRARLMGYEAVYEWFGGCVYAEVRKEAA